MADGFLIGSAFIKVTPDTSGFKADLDAQTADAGTAVKVKVTPDASDFAAKLRAAVDAAGIPSESVKITADLTGLNAGVADADAKLDEVGARKALPSLGLDAGTFAAAMADAMARLDEAGARSVTARLSLDDTGFKAKLDADMAELAAASSAGGGGGGIGLLGAGIAGGVLGGAALPGALAGAGGAVGALALAFGGINTALTAYQTQAAAAAKATQGVGSSATQASQQVRSAQQAVSDAETQSAHDAITSAESIKNAQAGVAAAVTAAAQSQASAEQQLQTAQYNEQQAQEALTAARAAAVLQLQQLDNAEQDTALSAQQAQLDLQQAQLNQQQTNASATSTALQKAQADLSVQEAEQRLKEALQARTNAANAATTADKEGVEGAPGVVAAKHGVATAEQAQAAAAQNLAQVEQAGAASIAKAQQGLADAERSASWQRAADAEHVQNAQQSLAAAYASAAGGSAAAAAAGNGYAAAMAKLSPASQQVVKDILSLKASLTGLESVSANAIAPGLAVFLSGIQSLLPEVSTEITAMGGILSSGLAAAGRALESSGFQKALAGILAEGNQFIQVIGPALGNLASAFVDLGARGGPAVAGLATGLAGLLSGVSDLLRGLAPFSAQAGTILAVLGQAAGLMGGPLAQAAGIMESAIAPLVQAALPAFASLAAAVSKALTTLQPVVTQLAGEIASVLAPSLSAIAGVLGAGLDGVITGVADALTGLMNAIGPEATGAAAIGIGAVVLGMKAWAAATAAMEGEGFLAMIAGWVTGISTFVEATEGATLAEKAMLATETLMDALNPFGWVVLGVAAIAGLTAAVMAGNTGMGSYIATQKQAADASSYNIAGYDKLGESLTATASSQQKLAQAVGTSAVGMGTARLGVTAYSQAQDQLTQAANQAWTTAGKLNDAMTSLGTQYGISEAGAIAVAKAAGIQATSWTSSAQALDKANAKFAAYIINNQDALAPQQEINGLMAIFGDNAENASTQTNALNTAWQILVGNFVSKQQAMLNASVAVQQYGTAAKQAGGNTQQLQQQFYATIQQLQPLIDQISKTHGPMGTLYQDLENQITALRNSGPLNAQEQTALSGLQKLADALANSTHGMTNAQQQAATMLEGTLIPQLVDLGVKGTTAKTDTQNLADAIVNTGTKSSATAADRAALIKDLTNAGVSAGTAAGLVDGFIKQVGLIPKSAPTKIGVTAQGQWSISETQLHALSGGAPVSSAAGGHIRGPGTETSDSILARLSDNEYVVKAAAVHKYGTGLLDSINTMRFAGGGGVNSTTPVGTPADVGSWADKEWNATNQFEIDGTENAMVAAINAAIAAAKSAAAAGGAGTPGPGGGAPAANAALAKKLYPAWAGGAEWTAWNAVAMRESGWNQFARNASSGAYGIPQALPPSKMGAAANPPDSNPTAQINWMIGYIKGRYGDPIGAEAHEQSAGWYDNGGWLMPGQTLARNGTGQPERVISPGQEKAAAAASPRVVNNNSFNYYGPQQPTPEMQQAMLVNLASMVGAAG